MSKKIAAEIKPARLAAEVKPARMAAAVKPARMQGEVNGIDSNNVLAISGFCSASFIK
ncbi:hypothetical protein ACPF4D_000260 [Vibrio cholerae]|jgi:hypothetical protein|nr:hypothetical protein [Vibrio cholerae]ELJ8615135.1 hypothetical protein [Vibrio cholerae]ELJ8693618.1 hypothetical protein [Vibrio cholerae]